MEAWKTSYQRTEPSFQKSNDTTPPLGAFPFQILLSKSLAVKLLDWGFKLEKESNVSNACISSGHLTSTE
uniref:Uncharacterized protein n=1 Tax=Picea sitchensis TaxID=3332 RepID=A0A6B9XQH4_PICSI|nr:hypothetical protein Q903MT_gene4357 [Picea sitchensis]